MQTHDSGLAPDDRRRLVGVLARLGSPHDGERSAAALLASRIVADRGLTWERLLPPALPAPDRPHREPQSEPDTYATDLALCSRNILSLTPWQQDFIANVFRRGAAASPKQRSIVARIARQLRAEGAR